MINKTKIIANIIGRLVAYSTEKQKAQRQYNALTKIYHDEFVDLISGAFDDIDIFKIRVYELHIKAKDNEYLNGLRCLQLKNIITHIDSLYATNLYYET